MDLASYEFIPAPLWVITVLHVVTVALHFAAMNFLLGGLLVLLLGRFGDRQNSPTVRRMATLLPSAMAATITFGVAPLLFLQLVYHRQAYAAAIVSAWFWLLILVVALAVYYLLYAVAPHGPDPRPRRPGLLWLALAGFLYIVFTYVSVFSLAERPELTHALYAANQSGWTLNPELGHTVPRWLHMVLGAMTVGAFWVGVVGRDDAVASRVAGGFYLGGMVAASLAGAIYLVTLGPALGPLAFGPGIWWLAVAVLLAYSSTLSFLRRRFVTAGALLGTSLLGMVTVRHLVRDLQLAAHFDPATLPVQPQWSVFVLFLVCFVLAAGLLVVMVRLYLRPTATTRQG